MRRYSSGYDFLFFIAILATLTSLAPALTHLIELPHKLSLSREAYFTVQQLYAGWELFGIAILVQLISLGLLAWRSAREYYVFRPVLAALICWSSPRPCSGSSPFPPMKLRKTGPACPRTGKYSVINGNIPMPAERSVSWRDCAA